MLYVRRSWLGLQDGQDTLLPGPFLLRPELRRLDNNTVEVILGETTRRYGVKYTFYGPWPARRLGD